jgi:excisionase family DNA binding protein
MPLKRGVRFEVGENIEDERRKRLKVETMESKWELFSTKEGARRLGISPQSLREMVRRKRIGVFRIGGRLMFNQWVLDMFMASVFEPQMEGGQYQR